MNGPPIDVLLREGRLEQVCPVRCQAGWRRGLDPETPEAAGSYCTACGTPTGSADWRKPDTTARAANVAKARAAQAAHRRSHQGNPGQALVEFALIFPLLMALLLASIETGLLLGAYQSQVQATGTLATWSGIHVDDSEGWDALAATQAPGCDVQRADDVDGGLIVVSVTCVRPPTVMRGLIDPITMTTTATAAIHETVVTP